jgi:hypothetical protein
MKRSSTRLARTALGVELRVPKRSAPLRKVDAGELRAAGLTLPHWCNGGVFVDRHYCVLVGGLQTAWGCVTRLAVARHDKHPLRSWADLQRIKNEVAGPERVAVEVFPPEAELVDEANFYHLWALPEGFELPFRVRSMRNEAPPETNRALAVGWVV